MTGTSGISEVAFARKISALKSAFFLHQGSREKPGREIFQPVHFL
jgi:hypothetical protein